MPVNASAEAQLPTMPQSKSMKQHVSSVKTCLSCLCAGVAAAVADVPTALPPTAASEPGKPLAPISKPTAPASKLAVRRNKRKGGAVAASLLGSQPSGVDMDEVWESQVWADLNFAIRTVTA